MDFWWATDRPPRPFDLLVVPVQPIAHQLAEVPAGVVPNPTEHAHTQGLQLRTVASQA